MYTFVRLSFEVYGFSKHWHISIQSTKCSSILFSRWIFSQRAALNCLCMWKYSVNCRDLYSPDALKMSFWEEFCQIYKACWELPVHCDAYVGVYKWRWNAISTRIRSVWVMSKILVELDNKKLYWVVVTYQ